MWHRGRRSWLGGWGWARCGGGGGDGSGAGLRAGGPGLRATRLRPARLCSARPRSARLRSGGGGCRVRVRASGGCRVGLLGEMPPRRRVAWRRRALGPPPCRGSGLRSGSGGCRTRLGVGPGHGWLGLGQGRHGPGCGRSGLRVGVGPGGGSPPVLIDPPSPALAGPVPLGSGALGPCGRAGSGVGVPRCASLVVMCLPARASRGAWVRAGAARGRGPGRAAGRTGLAPCPVGRPVAQPLP